MMSLRSSPYWVRLSLFALLCVGCSEQSSGLMGQEPVPPVPPPVTPSALNVREFGARGDGQTNDTFAFEAAIRALPASGGTIHVPGGIYMLGAVGTNPNRALDLTDKSNVIIAGEGMDSSILRMSAATYQGATFMALMKNARGITLQDLTFDGNRDQVIYKDEQSHGVQIVSSDDITISRVRFENSGGDGVRLFGLTAQGGSWTENVVIEDSEFRDATRNGISIQRETRNIVIRGNHFERISDQSISAEPTGRGAPRGIVVEDNVVNHSFKTTAVALAGPKPTEPLHGLTFRNNQVQNGAVYFLRVDSLIVEGNTLVGDPYRHVLRLEDIHQASITNNLIKGMAEQGPGTIQILNHGGLNSSGITLSNNHIEIAEGLTGIYVRDALSDISISTNTIRGAAGDTGIHFNNIVVVGQDRTGISVTDNVILNFQSGIILRTRGDDYENVEIKLNKIDSMKGLGETVGILFERTGPYQLFADVTGNEFGNGITTRIVVSE